MSIFRPQVGISACLFGKPVRYDGQHKQHELIMQYVAPQVDLIPVCPEIGIGLGVPRETIQLVQHQGIFDVVDTATGKTRYSSELEKYADSILQQYPALNAFIFKSRSPSCGLGSTPVMTIPGMTTQSATAYGQFAWRLYHKNQTLDKKLLLIEESQLYNAQQCLHFINQLFDSG